MILFNSQCYHQACGFSYEMLQRPLLRKGQLHSWMSQVGSWLEIQRFENWVHYLRDFAFMESASTSINSFQVSAGNSTDVSMAESLHEFLASVLHTQAFWTSDVSDVLV